MTTQPQTPRAARMKGPGRWVHALARHRLPYRRHRDCYRGWAWSANRAKRPPSLNPTLDHALTADDAHERSYRTAGAALGLTSPPASSGSLALRCPKCQHVWCSRSSDSLQPDAEEVGASGA